MFLKPKSESRPTCWGTKSTDSLGFSELKDNRIICVEVRKSTSISSQLLFFWRIKMTSPGTVICFLLRSDNIFHFSFKFHSTHILLLLSIINFLLCPAVLCFALIFVSQHKITVGSCFIVRKNVTSHIAVMNNFFKNLSLKHTVCFTNLGKLNLLMVVRF